MNNINHPPDRSVLSDDNPCSCIGVTDGDAGDREVAGSSDVTRGTVNDQDTHGLAVLECSRTGGRGRQDHEHVWSVTSNNTSLIDYP